MPRLIRTALGILVLSLLATTSSAQDGDDPSGADLYAQYCATCHGADLSGGNGSNLSDGEWTSGSTLEKIHQNIKNGMADRGMPAFGETLDDGEIDRIIDHIQDVEQD
ncbi:MAG: c-type cytochrome, partial [Rhodothermales bacterium]